MKKNLLVMVLGIVLTISLIGCSKKSEEPVTTDPVIEAEVVEEVTPVVEEVVEPEVIEIAEPEVNEVVEEPIVIEAPVEEVTTEPTPVEVVEIMPEPTEAPTPKPTATPKPEPTKAPAKESTPKPTTAPTPKATEKPEPEVIIEATEEEMITGKFNKFDKVISEITETGEFTGWLSVLTDNATITLTKDGFNSTGRAVYFVEALEWTNIQEYITTVKYGDTAWNFEDSDGNIWTRELPVLTKETTNFGLDYTRFKVKSFNADKDVITITGVYTLSPAMDSIYEMLTNSAVLYYYNLRGDFNKVTADVTIKLDAKTKSMEKITFKYNLNGEVFGKEDEYGVMRSVEEYSHTLTFK